jgi:hypothetical protein
MATLATLARRGTSPNGQTRALRSASPGRPAGRPAEHRGRDVADAGGLGDTLQPVGGGGADRRVVHVHAVVRPAREVRRGEHRLGGRVVREHRARERLRERLARRGGQGRAGRDEVGGTLG